MENFKITEKLSDGTQTELRISDVIGRLLQRAELIYDKDAIRQICEKAINEEDLK